MMPFYQNKDWNNRTEVVALNTMQFQHLQGVLYFTPTHLLSKLILLEKMLIKAKILLKQTFLVLILYIK